MPLGGLRLATVPEGVAVGHDEHVCGMHVAVQGLEVQVMAMS